MGRDKVVIPMYKVCSQCGNRFDDHGVTVFLYGSIICHVCARREIKDREHKSALDEVFDIIRDKLVGMCKP